MAVFFFWSRHLPISSFVLRTERGVDMYARRHDVAFANSACLLALSHSHRHVRMIRIRALLLCAGLIALRFAVLADARQHASSTYVARSSWVCFFFFCDLSRLSKKSRCKRKEKNVRTHLVSSVPKKGPQKKKQTKKMRALDCRQHAGSRPLCLLSY